MAKLGRQEARVRRHRRVRKSLAGTADKPRLAVFKSNFHIYAQVIDDDSAITLVAASTVEPDLKKALSVGGNVESAKKVGELVAARAKAKGVTSVVFDRGGFKYHGRVQALADAAREGGLVF